MNVFVPPLCALKSLYFCHIFYVNNRKKLRIYMKWSVFVSCECYLILASKLISSAVSSSHLSLILFGWLVVVLQIKKLKWMEKKKIFPVLTILSYSLSLSASSTEHDQCLQFPDVTGSSDHLHRPTVGGFPGSPAGSQPMDRDSVHHLGPGGGRARWFRERQQRRRTQAQWRHYR